MLAQYDYLLNFLPETPVWPAEEACAESFQGYHGIQLGPQICLRPLSSQFLWSFWECQLLSLMKTLNL